MQTEKISLLKTCKACGRRFPKEDMMYNVGGIGYVCSITCQDRIDELNDDSPTARRYRRKNNI